MMTTWVSHERRNASRIFAPSCELVERGKYIQATVTGVERVLERLGLSFLRWPLYPSPSDCVRAVPGPDLIHGTVESALFGTPGVVEEIALCRGVAHEPSRSDAEQTDRKNRLWNSHFKKLDCRLPDDGGYIRRLIQGPRAGVCAKVRGANLQLNRTGADALMSQSLAELFH
jgi:hypothetical protein